jgi:hypothetical protein
MPPGSHLPVDRPFWLIRPKEKRLIFSERADLERAQLAELFVDRFASGGRERRSLPDTGL